MDRERRPGDKHLGRLCDAPADKPPRRRLARYRDKHLGRLPNAEALPEAYASRAVAFWRAALSVPEERRDSSLFAAACLAGSSRDLAFATRHAGTARVDAWAGADVVVAVAAAVAKRPCVAGDDDAAA